MRYVNLVLALALISTLTLCFSVVVWHGVAQVSSAEYPKSKTFYFHNSTKTILDQDHYIMNTFLPEEETPVEIIFYDAEKVLKWFIDPPLAGSLSLNGTVSLNIWMKLISGAGEGTLFVTLRLGLYEILENGTRICIIDEGNTINQATLGPITSHFSEYSVKGYIQTAYDAVAGSRLEVVLSIGSNDRARKHIIWGSSDFRSRVSLPAINHIHVSSVNALNATGMQPPYFNVNDTIVFQATITDPFGGYDVRWVNLTLEAPDGSIIFQKAAMKLTSGNDTSFICVYELSWETKPKINGTYYVTVEAVDNTGYYYRFPDRPGDESFGGHLETKSITFSVGKVISAVFIIQDSLTNPLSGAVLELWDDINLIDRTVTNQTGWAKTSNIPGAGDYTVVVWWQNVKVFDQIVRINETSSEENPIILQTAVYYPTFKIVDDANMPLQDASVYVTYPNGTTPIFPVKTDAQGQFNLTKIAGGLHMLRIIWSGVEVGLKSVNVSSNQICIVKADVFYLTIRIEDPKGRPVGGVHVIIHDVSRAIVADSKLSNTSGIIICRLPTATYDLKATWLGAGVASIKGIKLDQTKTITMTLKIFDVEINIVDQKKLPLESSIVEITFEGFYVVGVSDEEGKVTFVLPQSTLNLRVWWENALVFDGNFTVSENIANVTIITEVYYVTVKTVDKNGNPLAGLHLTLQKNGAEVTDGGFTNSEGIHEFRQPAGNYTVIAELKTSYFLTSIHYIETKTFQVPPDTTVTIIFSSFPMPFTSTILFYAILALIGSCMVPILVMFFRKFKLW